MTTNSSLMAHLVPRLTPQVENAATEALAYILNSSAECMQALNDLLQEGGFAIEPIARVTTQVTYEDGCIPDMAGYDKNNITRLLVEAKFWAALGEGQASGYSRHLAQPGRAMMMLISPEIRVPTMWVEIGRQMEGEGKLEFMESNPGTRRAKVVRTEPRDTDLQLILISWTRLLDKMDALTDELGVKSDIQQLRGLAQTQDERAFLPLHSEDLNPSIGLRIIWFRQLVNDAVDCRGVPEGWMDTQGLSSSGQGRGYGRYFRYPGTNNDLYFGFNPERWSHYANTPLWFCGYDGSREFIWNPIYPKLGVEYDAVLDDVASQLKIMAENVQAQLKGEHSPIP